MKYKQLACLFPIAAIGLSIGFLVPRAQGNDQNTVADAAPFTVDHGNVSIPEQSPLRSRLQVQAVTPAETTHAIVIPGQVDANPALTVNVLPPLTGRVVDIKVQLGDQVKKGQLLATIASGDMAQAYSDVEKARDALDLAKKTRDRTRGVGQVGAAAIKDIEAADSGVTQAESELNRAQTRLDSFGGLAEGKSGTRILNMTAPCNGMVTALNVGKGGFVDDPTATFMTITDISSVYVTAYIPENQVNAIKQGQEAAIALSAYPGERLSGHVDNLSNVMAPDTRRLPAHLVFDNPNGHLIPNMYADLTFKVPQAPEVIVPQSALLMNNDSTTVFVEVAPWTFTRRVVDISYDEGNQVRILSGLKAGDRVVVKGGVLIND